MSKCRFDFSSPANGIKRCAGYVIGETTPTSYGVDFRPIKTVVSFYMGKNPDKEKIEELAVYYCEVTK